MKKIKLTVALAMTITACSPHEKTSDFDNNPIPQVSVSESVFNVRHLLSIEANKKEPIPMIAKAVLEAKPVPKMTAAADKPKITPKSIAVVTKSSTVQKNIVNHLLKYKVNKSDSTKFATLIVQNSKTYGVDPYTILAIIQVETGATFDPNLVSTHGSVGLLQVLPSTQKYMNISGNLKKPSINIKIGTKYLAYTQKRFGNELGIVAYNQGEGNVKRGTYNTKYLTKVNKALAKIKK
ncbi:MULTISPECIES: transglycosylase SLT domain-containing protein [Paenibacillus]|uniref:transglycosylase SLT domain-containing protein n=1 Tax=Paenibacillus TaxID=44249 RepID=UPI000B87DA77|nr:transglycosylase SLT domain-containing protein [Paenibacillus amylolyticus]